MSNDDRKATERARYLRRVVDMDLSRDKALALAYREQGYAHHAIARKVGVASGTAGGWLDRITARYGLEATETKYETDIDDPEPMTVDRLAQYSDSREETGRSVRDDYRDIAVANPDVVPAPVLNALSDDQEGVE